MEEIIQCLGFALKYQEGKGQNTVKKTDHVLKNVEAERRTYGDSLYSSVSSVNV